MTDSYGDLHNGSRNATVYYWLDPDTGSALYHTEVNDEAAVPFLPDICSAETYLEQCAEAGDRDRYAKYSHYQARTRKVGDAVNLLTDQIRINDFSLVRTDPLPTPTTPLSLI